MPIPAGRGRAVNDAGILTAVVLPRRHRLAGAAMSAQLSPDRHSGVVAADLHSAHGQEGPQRSRSSSPALPDKLRGLPVTSVAQGKIELRQSAANLLSLPILLAVVLLAAIIRQLFVQTLARRIDEGLADEEDVMIYETITDPDVQVTEKQQRRREGQYKRHIRRRANGARDDPRA
jgi:hypothetical protein